jgi:hypothetical protein
MGSFSPRSTAVTGGESGEIEKHASKETLTSHGALQGIADYMVELSAYRGLTHLFHTSLRAVNHNNHSPKVTHMTAKQNQNRPDQAPMTPSSI